MVLGIYGKKSGAVPALTYLPGERNRLGCLTGERGTHQQKDMDNRAEAVRKKKKKSACGWEGPVFHHAGVGGLLAMVVRPVRKKKGRVLEKTHIWSVTQPGP